MQESKNLPKWTFDDAYVDFDNDRFIKAVQDVNLLINETKFEDEDLISQIKIYEKAFDITSSLKAFCRCKLSENTKDERVGAIEEKIEKYISKLNCMREILLQGLSEIDEEDELWQNSSLSHWKFFHARHKNHWRNSLPNKEIYDSLRQSNFISLYSVFTHLNNHINVEALDLNGNLKTYNLSKCVGILKGSPDGVLRKNIFEGLSEHYEKYAVLYTDTLNMLQGFRLNEFKSANVDILSPSYEQNKISKQAVNAMYEALSHKVEQIRETVNLRAKYIGKDQISSYDLLAPSPFCDKKEIPYHQAMDTICKALGEVSPKIVDFIKMMLDNRWIEADVRDYKAGGAFYTRFNELKQPRVFSSYMGTQAHMIQQAHELGHAWHYWIMRDMPTIQTEFPMSLAETASMFNEAVLRNYLRKNSDSKNLLFDILWQELKSAANFMLHISVRYDFEISMLQARQSGSLTPKDIKSLLERAWCKWYGRSTDDVEWFLPYFKLHFYKTDQYIYNYPYTVGYLLSQFLIGEFRRSGAEFIDVYKPFLRDCGKESVDDIVKKYFNKDVKSKEFWIECIDEALSYVSEFKKIKP